MLEDITVERLRMRDSTITKPDRLTFYFLRTLVCMTYITRTENPSKWKIYVANIQSFVDRVKR